MAGLDQALAGVTRWIGTNLIIDTVRVSLPGVGEPVLNTTTGELVYPEGDTLYEGPGGVVAGSATMERSAVPEAGQPWAQQTRSTYVLLTPLTAPIPRNMRSCPSCRSMTRPARRSSAGRGSAPTKAKPEPSRSYAAPPWTRTGPRTVHHDPRRTRRPPGRCRRQPR